MKAELILLFFVAFAANVEARRRCYPVDSGVPICKKRHETYTECGPAPGCEVTCEMPTGGFVCPSVCVAGCFCEAGYIRDPKGNCVLKENCPKPECEKRNEEWSDCGENPCEATCDFPTRPQTCRAACRPGCGCKDGYIRDDDSGECIRPWRCPEKLQCGPNEDYFKCSALCVEKTCDNREDRYCGLGCEEKCLCKEGYIRDENRRCIRIEECPAVEPVCTKSHEEYQTCGTLCPKRCDSPPDIICARICVSGCFCESGYIRDADGNCILPEECPNRQCGPNEHFDACDRTCGSLDCEEYRGYLACDPTGECNTGCFCNQGYAIDHYNNTGCIPVEECPIIWELECGRKNEVYSECGAHGCQATCDNPELPTVCLGVCTEGCICPEGYIRSGDGNCVLPQDCPR